MNPIFFQFKNEPEDFPQNGEPLKLPHPGKEKQELWQWFLPDFHIDDRKTLLENCYKYCEDQDLFEFDREELAGNPELRNKSSVLHLIEKLETELTREALHEFYQMLYKGEIEIFSEHPAG